MTACHTVREDLTAWVDGELPLRRSEQLRRHLTDCAVCAAEAQRARAAMSRQRSVLTRALGAEEVDANALWSRLRTAMAEAAPEADPWWRLRWRPLMVAGTAVAAAAVTLFLLAGGPDTILVPLGIETPPVELAREPELFRDYPIIERLDALEYFDRVQTVPLEEGGAASKSHNG
jgi:hypothetical protein